ncbi:hypothetical protein LGM46_33255, partial [Burkholderia arboris]|uniref:hypothetical protein n=1 Tax=Burkholderia arboris TaxID=488730 RepID=UPI001CF473A6
APRRADRCVMLLANTSSIRFVAILALGPSGGQRKPVISVNTPSRHAHAAVTPPRQPSVRCMPDPDANIICRNIDMHALTDIACVAAPLAATSIAPSRWRVPVSRSAPHGNPSPFPAFTT